MRVVTDIQSRVDPDVERVQLSEHVDAPARVTILASDYRGFDVEVVLAARWGGFDCASVQVSQRRGGPAVTGEALRLVAIGDLTTEAVQHVFVTVPDPNRPEGPVLGVPVTLGGGPGAGTIREFWGSRDGRLQDMALHQIAAHYIVADSVGLPPTKEVQTTFDVSRATASRMVAAARERGYIPPAPDRQSRSSE